MISEEQKIQRMNHVGASVVAAVPGIDCHPFLTAYDLWLFRTGKLEEKPTPVDGKDPLYLGNLLEPPIAIFER